MRMHRNTTDFIKTLPYKLTEGQMKTIEDTSSDISKHRRSNGKWNMNRIVQGDVGSGKTVVATATIIECLSLMGGQAMYMAPTESLAIQQGEYLERVLTPGGMTVITVTSKSRSSNAESLMAITDGKYDVVVGTHAILSDKIRPPNANIVVIDEQQKFGVAHRVCAGLKATKPNILVLTATPIPRTVAHMLMGRIDTSVIPEKPSGRRPIKTITINGESRKINDSRVNKAIRRAIDGGGKVFVVFAAVEKELSMGGKLRALTDEVERMRKQLKTRISTVHGKLKSEAKVANMEEFAHGPSKILAATSAIEVGVDVPEATTMVIYNCEQFGISQLHQMRGRVGRNNKQAWCILVNEKKLNKKGTVTAPTEEEEAAAEKKKSEGKPPEPPKPSSADKRVEDLTKTQDGDELALRDLERRGPGDVDGVLQKGWQTDAEAREEALKTGSQGIRATVNEKLHGSPSRPGKRPREGPGDDAGRSPGEGRRKRRSDERKS